MARVRTHLNILHWSGKLFDEEPNDELKSEHTIDDSAMASIWGFKIFESIGACATHAEESDMQKYRALASVLGAGSLREGMITMYWFEGRELAVLYAALCNLQTQFLDKSRMNLEKTLMRNALERPDSEEGISALRCAIKSQASMMVGHVAELMGMIDEALNENNRVLLSVT